MRGILTRVGRQGVLLGIALAAVAAGVATIGVAVAAQQDPPTAPPSARGTLRHSERLSTPSTTAPTRDTHTGKMPGDNRRPAAGAPGQAAASPHEPAESATTPQRQDPLAPSVPTGISIPALDVHSAVFPIGKTKHGTLQVPQPGPRLNKAAWFENSPTPGQTGPSIIEGHVDTERGPSVFFKLGDIRPGNRVTISRRDGTTVVFTVNAVRDFPKKHFPTRLVYGGNLSEPTLRLITCSDFDDTIGHHTGNLIVFAHRTAVHPPA